MEIDPGLADGHAALAQVYADHLWDFERAEREYLRALELNPNSDVAHSQYAYVLLYRRDFDRALEHARRATEIDPISPAWAVLRALILDWSGRHAEALRYLEETARVHPSAIPVLLHTGMALTNAGRPEEGARKFAEALEIAKDSTQLLALQAWALARAGRRDEALRIIRDIEKRGERQPVAAPNLALAWTALGDHDRAFHWLDRALRDRLFLVRIAAVHPGFEPLRSDPRYADVVRRMGM